MQHFSFITSINARAMTEEAHRYEYYLLGNTIPVRVVYSASGLKIGAEATNPATNTLRPANTYLSRLERSDEADEITAEDFHARCQRIYDQSV